MTAMSKFDLSSAEIAFAVANTPAFLARKLCADDTAQTMFKTFGSKKILSALRVAVRYEPKTLSNAVRPYVYLVALSMAPDKSPLVKASNISAPNFDWYKQFVQLLVDTYNPTIIREIHVPGQLIAPDSSRQSTAPVQRFTYRVED